MQLSSVTSASIARPVRPSVESTWRDRGRAEPTKSAASAPPVSHKPEIAAPRSVAARQQQSTQDDRATNYDNPSSTGLSDELVHQQQSAEVYTAQLRTPAANESAPARRKDAADERGPSPASAHVAYTAERANRIYREHAGQQSGRMVDEMV